MVKICNLINPHCDYINTYQVYYFASSESYRDSGLFWYFKLFTTEPKIVNNFRRLCRCSCCSLSYWKAVSVCFAIRVMNISPYPLLNSPHANGSLLMCRLYNTSWASSCSFISWRLRAIRARNCQPSSITVCPGRWKRFAYSSARFQFSICDTLISYSMVIVYTIIVNCGSHSTTKIFLSHGSIW